ncbi:MAG: 2OG-Fe(II) oxygenase [Terriglobales bacterium]
MKAILRNRLTAIDWESVTRELNERGHCVTEPILTEEECHDLSDMYADEKRFRSHIVMARYRFGSGDYKYFAHPLPDIVREMRSAFYRRLAPVANDWNEKLGSEQRFPAEHEELLKMCHHRGQKRPTPLLLHYEAGDYNCLHQDLYGQVAFPLQLTCFLSKKSEYTGGEFLLMEQQPRAQSKAEVIAPEQGQVLVFTTRYRPKHGSRGYFRVNVRHGVSRVHSGVRYTLGIPFHDAE